MADISVGGPYPLCPECGAHLVPTTIEIKKKADREVTKISWQCTKCDNTI